VGTILILGLGIGANTVVFSVVERVLLRPLPYPDSDRLYRITEVIPAVSDKYPSVPVTAPHLLSWREHATSFEGLAGIQNTTLNLTGTGEPERLSGARVSWDFFGLLGVRPVLGRSFAEEEDRPGRDGVVLISEGLWTRRFGRDPAILGRTIALDGKPYSVIGVLPAGFSFARNEQFHHFMQLGDRIDFWKPMAFDEEEATTQLGWNYGVVARLRAGMSADRARAELDASLAELAKELPEPFELRVELVPLQEALVGSSRRGLLLLLAAVGAVLLVACVNVANLLLVRATVRQKEIAVRAALGAGRRALLRHALTESLLLAGAGGAIGSALSAAGVAALARWAPHDLPRVEEIGLDWRALAFAVSLSVATALLCGLLPALRLSLLDPQQTLRQGPRGATQAGAGARLRNALVSAEVALSALLLVLGGLLIHSFLELGRVEKGFQTEHVLTVDLGLPENGYDERERRVDFYRQALERLAVLPGVTSAGAVSKLPLTGEDDVTPVRAEGTTATLLEQPIANWRRVSADYFRTLGVPLRRGQVFADDGGAAQSVILSQGLAHQLWPEEDPIGKRINREVGDSTLVEVVGVVADVRILGLDQKPGFTVYVPFWQAPSYNMSLALRTALPPQALAGAVRREIHAVDPNLPVPSIRTMGEVAASSTAQRRFQMQLVGAFALAALVLASLGVFGVVSYSVAQRRGEIGVRMALGATGGDLWRSVLGQGLRPVAIGLVIGLVASLAAARAIESLLFGVGAVDPLTLTAVPSVLLLFAGAACVVPAIRASRVDPMVTLRAE
jgi:putative ABC transport system permease protein